MSATTTAVLRKRLEALETQRSGAGGLRVLVCPRPFTPQEQAAWLAERTGPGDRHRTTVVILRLTAPSEIEERNHEV